jgi:hypothetical protein
MEKKKSEEGWWVGVSGQVKGRGELTFKLFFLFWK